MIEIKDLQKIYKLNAKKMKELKTKDTVKKAVDGVSFTAKPGEIYCLLGPNGAGKTTTLRCVATLLKPTAGKVTVCGYDTVKEGAKVRDKLAFLTNEIKLDPNFSAEYMFHFFGRLHGMSEEEIGKRQDELFDIFGIEKFKDKKIEEQSASLKEKDDKIAELSKNPGESSATVHHGGPGDPAEMSDEDAAKLAEDFVAAMR